MINYSILCIFECSTYTYINKGNIEPKSKKFILLGYQNGIKEYRLWDYKESKFIIRIDLTFDEVVTCDKVS